mmetsp:Transcript_36132/g.84547  ORF Transcript_36132/g.84547 Transcript_36132/m.84547 type:complete len:288 (+) Transcript_36132:1317-2180(+)
MHRPGGCRPELGLAQEASLRAAGTRARVRRVRRAGPLPRLRWEPGTGLDVDGHRRPGYRRCCRRRRGFGRLFAQPMPSSRCISCCCGLGAGGRASILENLGGLDEVRRHTANPTTILLSIVSDQAAVLCKRFLIPIVGDDAGVFREHKLLILVRVSRTFGQPSVAVPPTPTGPGHLEVLHSPRGGRPLRGREPALVSAIGEDAGVVGHHHGILQILLVASAELDATVAPALPICQVRHGVHGLHSLIVAEICHHAVELQSRRYSLVLLQAPSSACAPGTQRNPHVCC